MKKIIKTTNIVIFIFLCLISADAIAQNSSLSLDVVPNSLKKSYLEQTGKEWDLSSYADRKAYWDFWLSEKKKDLKTKKITVAEFQDYGEELLNVPFELKYSFYKNHGIKWEDATLDQKKTFIEKYTEDAESLQKKLKKEEKADLKEEKARIKAKLKEKKTLEKRMKAREKAEERIRKAEEKKDKEFQKQVADQEKRLEELRREFENKRKK